ncbi:hypothetical protein BSL78_26697 [Apostichopus japonicus]|uniref:Uncharacterized protein n=1 Tax=Stichopus japonicus TaxID=307972 RepID=A0A2G8JL36_STIJA|nr:hypothetical protein BSL78_26697 [Apostichopus japonicus]
MKDEKKRQKEFFEKQKSARRMKLHNRDDENKDHPSSSLDLISLQMAHLTAQQFKNSDTNKKPKHLSKVNMERPSSMGGFHFQRHNFVDLPTSPHSTPSLLQLSDDIPSSSRELHRSHTSSQVSHISSSLMSQRQIQPFTGYQDQRLHEVRSQAVASQVRDTRMSSVRAPATSDSQPRRQERSSERTVVGQRKVPEGVQVDHRRPPEGMLIGQMRSSEDIFFQFTSSAPQRTTFALRETTVASSNEMFLDSESSDDCTMYSPDERGQGYHSSRMTNEASSSLRERTETSKLYNIMPQILLPFAKLTAQSRKFIQFYQSRRRNKECNQWSSCTFGVPGGQLCTHGVPDDQVYTLGRCGPRNNREDSPTAIPGRESPVDLLCHETTNFTSPESVVYIPSQELNQHEVSKQESPNERDIQRTLQSPGVRSADLSRLRTNKNRSSSISSSSLSSLQDGFPRSVLREVLDLDADLNRGYSSPGGLDDFDELPSSLKKRKLDTLFIESFQEDSCKESGSLSSHLSRSSDSCVTSPPPPSPRLSHEKKKKPSIREAGDTKTDRRIPETRASPLSPYSRDVQRRALESISLISPEGRQEKTPENVAHAKNNEISRPADQNLKEDVRNSISKPVEISEYSSGSDVGQLGHIESEGGQSTEQLVAGQVHVSSGHGLTQKGVQCEIGKPSVKEQGTQSDCRISIESWKDSGTQTEETVSCDKGTQWDGREGQRLAGRSNPLSGNYEEMPVENKRDGMQRRDDRMKTEEDGSSKGIVSNNNSEKGVRIAHSGLVSSTASRGSQISPDTDRAITTGGLTREVDESSTVQKGPLEMNNGQQSALETKFILDKPQEKCLESVEIDVIELIGGASASLSDVGSDEEVAERNDNQMAPGEATREEDERCKSQVADNPETEDSTLSDSVNLFSAESSYSDTFDSCKSV